MSQFIFAYLFVLVYIFLSTECVFVSVTLFIYIFYRICGHVIKLVLCAKTCEKYLTRDIWLKTGEKFGETSSIHIRKFLYINIILNIEFFILFFIFGILIN